MMIKHTLLSLMAIFFFPICLMGDPVEETPWIEPHESNFYFRNTGVQPKKIPAHYPSQFKKFAEEQQNDSKASENPYIIEAKSDTDLSLFDNSDEYGPSYRLIKFEKEQEIPKKDFNDRYKLKIGDTLQIFIYGEAGTNQDVTVDPMGNVSYLFVNEIPAMGKTINEIRDILTSELQSYYKYVYLAITPIEIRGNFYTIMGEVMDPGQKEIIGNATITTALCDAKGFTNRIFYNTTTDNAELSRSFISRDGEILPVNFESLIMDGDATQDIPLMQGDYIYIASADQRQIYVLGEVGGASTIDFLTTITLSEAIAQSGGLTPRSSSRVVVIRGSLGCPIRYLIDINRILKGYACDFRLEPGDIVYVPPRKFTNLRELFRSAVATFVSTVASYAGTKAFVEIQPNAIGRVVTPVPIIQTGGGGTFTAPVPATATP